MRTALQPVVAATAAVQTASAGLGILWSRAAIPQRRRHTRTRQYSVARLTTTATPTDQHSMRALFREPATLVRYRTGRKARQQSASARRHRNSKRRPRPLTTTLGPAR